MANIAYRHRGRRRRHRHLKVRSIRLSLQPLIQCDIECGAPHTIDQLHIALAAIEIGNCKTARLGGGVKRARARDTYGHTINRRNRRFSYNQNYTVQQTANENAGTMP